MKPPFEAAFQLPQPSLHAALLHLPRAAQSPKLEPALLLHPPPPLFPVIEQHVRVHLFKIPGEEPRVRLLLHHALFRQHAGHLALVLDRHSKHCLRGVLERVLALGDRDVAPLSPGAAEPEHGVDACFVRADAMRDADDVTREGVEREAAGGLARGVLERVQARVGDVAVRERVADRDAVDDGDRQQQRADGRRVHAADGLADEEDERVVERRRRQRRGVAVERARGLREQPFRDFAVGERQLQRLAQARGRVGGEFLEGGHCARMHGWGWDTRGVGDCGGGA